MPKELKDKAAAIIVGHPMGASKEQAASVYAAQLAAKGFVTLALDQKFWGESCGSPRHAIAQIFTRKLLWRYLIFGEREILLILKKLAFWECGSDSIAISAAKIDPHMNAVAAVSMYNIGEMRHIAIINSQSLEQRKKMMADAASARFDNFLGKECTLTGGAPFSI